MLLAVAYHYVADRAPDRPRAIFPVTTDSLRHQIELLARSFELVSRAQLLAAVDCDAALPKRACVLTFDDGLRSQFEQAVPVLEQLGAPAIFFVPGLPLAEGRVLTVHKIQALRDRLDGNELAERLEEALLRQKVAPSDVSDGQAHALYRYDTQEAARVKLLLTRTLPARARRAIVDALFEREFPDEEAFATELYMDRAQIAELEQMHGAVGAHSYEHEALALLPPAELDEDVRRVSRLLQDLTGVRPRVFSYPYGTGDAISPLVAERLRAGGYAAAFTMERALNHTLDDPLLLARVDANDAPGGKQPVLEAGLG